MTETDPVLHIDWTRRAGRGLCAELLDDLLARDDWGYPISRTRDRVPHIPHHSLPATQDAVRLCPRLALSVHGHAPRFHRNRLRDMPTGRRQHYRRLR